MPRSAGVVARDDLLAEVSVHAALRGVQQARNLVLAPPRPGGVPAGEPTAPTRTSPIGLRLPEPQLWVTDRHGGRRYRLDLAYRERRVGMRRRTVAHLDRDRLRQTGSGSTGWMQRAGGCATSPTVTSTAAPNTSAPPSAQPSRNPPAPPSPPLPARPSPPSCAILHISVPTMAINKTSGGLNRWLQHPSVIFVGVVMASRLSPLEREQIGLGRAAVSRCGRSRKGWSGRRRRSRGR